jgi:HSP20 family molecular chaperone IbpA
MSDERLSETWMWERAEELLHQADKLQRQFFQLGSPGSRRAAWEPPVDVFETPERVIVLVALPGVRGDRVQVRLEDTTLVVAGERTLPESCARAAVRRLEIPQGHFRRAIPLSTPELELVSEELSDGCLVIELVKQDV